MAESRRRRVTPPRAVIVLAAYPGRGPAEKAARSLVEDRFVACATVAPGARAFYRWEGKIRADASVLLWAKTSAGRARVAVEAIRARHPDRVPEILVIPIRGGHAPYLDWLLREVGPA
ncbi:MAG: divalent-cation tolerance protein CutA [Candidatus Eiseniibacteriota bacterium]